MPVWLTLFGALFGTGAFFFILYSIVTGLVEGKRVAARPHLGIATGEKPGTLAFWATWKPGQFDVQIYRFRVKLTNPYGSPMERTFTVTYDPPQKESFIQSVELPNDVRAVIEDANFKRNALLTVDFRTVEELTQAVDYSLADVRNVYSGKKSAAPAKATRLQPTVIDEPSVTSLEYSELVVRRKKLKELEAAAKAKAAKAAAAATATAAAPAAAPTPATTTAPAKAPETAAAPKAETPKVATPETAKAATPETPKAAPATGAPVPSIKSVIAQDNAKNKEKTKEAAKKEKSELEKA